MSPQYGHIYVDSDGVVRIGDRYAAHARMYDQHLSELRSLRAEHTGSWGNDESGRKFGEKFVAGLDALESVVLLSINRLDYTAEGFRRAGRGYADAEDYAGDAGRRLAGGDASAPASPASAGPGGTDSGGPGARANVLSSGTDIPGTPADPATGTLIPQETFLKPAVPATPAIGPDGTLIAGESFSTAAEPAFSAHDSRDFSVAMVDGRPLTDGSRLMAFAPLPGGIIEVDANLFTSIVPVDAASVTGPDGTPLDAGGSQFFVVRDNPEVDPTAPGYQPLHIAFPAGGNPPVPDVPR